MRTVVVLTAISAFLSAGCGGEFRTTDSLSSGLGGLAERKDFLERYVTFRREYDDLQFSVFFNDGGAGGVLSPSEWDIRVYAVVPAGQLDVWVEGLEVIDGSDLGWVSKVPSAPRQLDAFVWHTDGKNVVVGIDKETRGVLYRNLSI